MSRAYYNEFDKFAAAWLRELITAGHIAPGDVDERDIQDVLPSDLAGYTQCHFFAGIGGWSYALRNSGWRDDRPVWTGSCPCQPFSAAGKGVAFADERHLWPAFHHLIKERRPIVVLGEQVASKDADPWIDLVQDDLEAVGYAFGAVPFPSAGVGAPHIRDRLYWCGALADAGGSGLAQRERIAGVSGRAAGPAQGQAAVGSGFRSVIGLGNADEGRGGRHAGTVPCAEGGAGRSVRGKPDGAQSTGTDGGMADAVSPGLGIVGRGRCNCSRDAGAHADIDHKGTRPGPTNGFWRAADWLGCRDGKFRPVEPGTFPLVDGAPARVGRLRGFGNAINAVQAQVFIETVMDCTQQKNELSTKGG